MEIAILGFCFIYIPIKYLIDFELFLEHNPGNFEKRVLNSEYQINRALWEKSWKYPKSKSENQKIDLNMEALSIDCRNIDCLCLLWEIAACYFYVVIYSLLYLDNSLLCWKIVNFFLVILTNNRLFSDITGCYLKIASCRWLQRFCLLFSK